MTNKYLTSEIEHNNQQYLDISLVTLLSGEDQTNDVIKVEERFNYAYCTADTLVKTGAGFIHTITITPTDAAATAGSIILYDNTTEADTVIFNYYIPAATLTPVTLTLDVEFSTGLYVGFTTTADVSATISYR